MIINTEIHYQIIETYRDTLLNKKVQFITQHRLSQHIFSIKKTKMNNIVPKLNRVDEMIVIKSWRYFQKSDYGKSR